MGRKTGSSIVIWFVVFWSKEHRSEYIYILCTGISFAIVPSILKSYRLFYVEKLQVVCCIIYNTVYSILVWCPSLYIWYLSYDPQQIYTPLEWVYQWKTSSNLRLGSYICQIHLTSIVHILHIIYYEDKHQRNSKVCIYAYTLSMQVTYLHKAKTVFVSTTNHLIWLQFW